MGCLEFVKGVMNGELGCDAGTALGAASGEGEGRGLAWQN